MSEAKQGDTVRINYTGAFTDGATFDSSEGREPLEFRLGAGEIIPGVDAAVTGMSVGETKQVVIAPAEGYGDRDESRVQEVPRAQLPDDIPTDPGTQLAMQTPEGQTLPVTVMKADAETVTLDANHPLAGRDLVFDLELVEIRKAA